MAFPVIRKFPSNMSDEAASTVVAPSGPGVPVVQYDEKANHTVLVCHIPCSLVNNGTALPEKIHAELMTAIAKGQAAELEWARANIKSGLRNGGQPLQNATITTTLEDVRMCGQWWVRVSMYLNRHELKFNEELLFVVVQRALPGHWDSDLETVYARIDSRGRVYIFGEQDGHTKPMMTTLYVGHGDVPAADVRDAIALGWSGDICTVAPAYQFWDGSLKNGEKLMVARIVCMRATRDYLERMQKYCAKLATQYGQSVVKAFVQPLGCSME